MPASKNLQFAGTTMLLGVLVVTYLFLVINLVILVVSFIAGMFKKKKKLTKSEEEY